MLKMYSYALFSEQYCMIQALSQTRSDIFYILRVFVSLTSHFDNIARIRMNFNKNNTQNRANKEYNTIQLFNFPKIKKNLSSTKNTEKIINYSRNLKKKVKNLKKNVIEDKYGGYQYKITLL